MRLRGIRFLDASFYRERDMSSTTTDTNTSRSSNTRIAFITQNPRRYMLLVYLVALLLLVAALWMRLHTLHVLFDRDSYDEGVYWQSLRAMSAGDTLYQQIFYSQPPFFLLSIFPIYQLFGQSIWAARLGIVIISLVGLLSAFLLGKTLRGYSGAIAALLLLIVAPIYLAESQILQADGPSAALSMLAVALAYLWWEHPQGLAGLSLAALTTLTLALGIFSKLLVVTALVPVGLLALAHLWRITHQPAGTRLKDAHSLLLGSAIFLLVTVLIFLPFIGSFSALWSDMVTFHTVASSVFRATRADNTATLRHFLNTPLTYLACFSTLVALWRRDWRVIPLLGWFIATAILIWQQTPLFQHHLVALAPPLVALAIMGLGPITWTKQRSAMLQNAIVALTVVLMLATVLINVEQIRIFYRGIETQANAANTPTEQQVIHDLQQSVQPQQQVITDAQFLAAQAGRDTPPSLVDTSTVRINSGYVTSPQLIQVAEQPQVQAVLFYTDRLVKQTAFYTWVSQHFRLIHTYGQDQELWVKIV